MKRWEAPFVVFFGLNWEPNAMAEDGTQWHGSRWVLVTTILKDNKICLTSLPGRTKEPERIEQRLASGEKRQKRHESKGKDEAESKARTNRSRARADGRSSVDRSLEHATSEEQTKEKLLCGVGLQCQRGKLVQRNAGFRRPLRHAKQKRLEKTMGTLKVLTMHLGCEPIGTDCVRWIPREWNAAADSLATRAIKRREDAFFLNYRWHTDRWGQAELLIMSGAGTRDNPSRQGMKQQGMGFLMMHRSTREQLAAASFFVETRWKQDDIIIL